MKFVFQRALAHFFAAKDVSLRSRLYNFCDIYKVCGDGDGDGDGDSDSDSDGDGEGDGDGDSDGRHLVHAEDFPDLLQTDLFSIRIPLLNRFLIR